MFTLLHYIVLIFKINHKFQIRKKSNITSTKQTDKIEDNANCYKQQERQVSFSYSTNDNGMVRTEWTLINFFWTTQTDINILNSKLEGVGDSC